MYNSSLGNYQQHYMCTSQLASNTYLPISTSIHSSLYGIRTRIGASSVHLAPPSYSSPSYSPPSYSDFDVSSLPDVNTGNVHSQDNRRTEANKSFRDRGDEKRNILLSNFNQRLCSSTSNDYATSSSHTNSAFMGLRIANDGKSLFLAVLTDLKSVFIGSYSTKRNDFHYQESAAPTFPSFNTESYAQDFPLPPLPDFEDRTEEPSLPPLPEFGVMNSFPGLETDEENETSQNVDINSFSSGHTGISFYQQDSRQSLASDILENIEIDQMQNMHVTSLPPTTSPWNPRTNMASYPLINQEESLPSLPSEGPNTNLYPESTSSNLIPEYMDQQNSPLPPLPTESLWNVNPDASTIPVGNNILDQENLLRGSPPDNPWNLDLNPVPENYTGNFFDLNTLTDQIIEAAFQNPSSFHVNM